MKVHTSKSSAAFTLTELLIAVAVTSVIVVMLGQVFSMAAKLWQAADAKTDAMRDARAALQSMAKDIGRAHINGDPQMLILAAVSGDHAQEVDAITPAKNPGKSDLCVIQYYLNWDGVTKTYSLVRRFKNSDTTNGYLANPTLDFGAIYDKSSGTEETIAAPVWGLEFRPGEKETVIAPGTDSAAKWKWIEIRLKTMSINSARKLKSIPTFNKADWDDPNSTSYKTFVLPYEEQLVTRVVLEQNQ